MTEPRTVHIETRGAALLAPRDQALADAASTGLAAALIGKDTTLWGAEASAEASVRLGWLDAPTTSAELLPRLRALREELVADGLTHVVLAGMGGSSLAPEVICRTAGVPLTVLDTTDPGQVRRVLDGDLDDVVVCVSSKSGGTIETDSHRRIFLQAFLDHGLSVDHARQRIVVVTDPGSPLAEQAENEHYREIFLADPDVGGRYSALTAFGLVPSAMAGADVASLLTDAAAVQPTLGQPADNPGLALGAALGGGGVAGRDKVVLAELAATAGGSPTGFGDWAEQLLAESTGKAGRGLLPVVVEGTDAPGYSPAADIHPVTLDGPASDPGSCVSGPLGAQFLVWEYATAVAGHILGINPFDQPNVAESKQNTNTILAEAGQAALPTGDPLFTDGAVSVYADADLLSGASDLAGALDALLSLVPARGYLAVMAYLDRIGDADAARLRPLLAARLAHPVTFGWGPRFLHSTGQFHKGGPPVGVFLQITGAVLLDVAVPGRDFSLGRLQAAQALGDLRALTGRARPVLRLHLSDRAAGVSQLIAAARGLG